MAGAPAHRLPYLLHGSSPHARGTLIGKHDGCLHPRFIPAYAGNASARRYKWPEWPVHPRMRGERISTARGSNSAPGSSPHARGTRRPRVHGQHRRRFIPACAGNAPPARRRACPPTVHPRIRGERATIVGRTPRLHGSSPHTRGTLDQPLVETPSLRFIPAYAGNAQPLV